MPHRRLRTVLVLSHRGGWGRAVRRGIRRYLHEHPNWEPVMGLTLSVEAIREVGRSRVSGVVVTAAPEEVTDLLTRWRVPVVELADVPRPHSAQVCTDNRQIARAALDYVQGLGIRSATFLGQHDSGSIAARLSHYRQRANELGMTWCPPLLTSEFWVARSRQRLQELCIRWAKKLPCPSAVLAFNDEIGEAFLEALRDSELRVPEDLAVLGVDDDEDICDFTIPPLSSVDPAAEQVGYIAARTLDAMMAGQPAPSEPVLVPPRGVIERASTDTLAVEDPAVAQAIQYIRRHAVEGISTADVAAAGPLARRSLERRFRATVGRSILAEIRRVQVNLARRLLLSTGLGLADIAVRSGFGSVSYLSRQFHRHVGMPPSEFRRHHGLSAGPHR